MRGNPPGVELFYAAKLIGFQARCVSDYVLDRSYPPFSRSLEVRTEARQLPELRFDNIRFGAEITGGVMRAVGFRRQSLLSMLLCDIASLSRLSITIVSLDWHSYTLNNNLNNFVGSRSCNSHYTILNERQRQKCSGSEIGADT